MDKQFRKVLRYKRLIRKFNLKEEVSLRNMSLKDLQQYQEEVVKKRDSLTGLEQTTIARHLWRIEFEIALKKEQAS